MCYSIILHVHSEIAAIVDNIDGTTKSYCIDVIFNFMVISSDEIKKTI